MVRHRATPSGFKRRARQNSLNCSSSHSRQASQQSPKARGRSRVSSENLCDTSRPYLTQTLITVGGKPGMVVGTSGKGRVAVIGMTCFGAPAESQTPFWQWRCWVLLLRDLAGWTAGQDEHFSETLP